MSDALYLQMTPKKHREKCFRIHFKVFEADMCAGEKKPFKGLAKDRPARGQALNQKIKSDAPKRGVSFKDPQKFSGREPRRQAKGWKTAENKCD